MIERAVMLFEPRVELEAVHFDTSALQEGELRIRLDYWLRSSNTRDNLVFPLYMNGQSPMLSLSKAATADGLGLGFDPNAVPVPQGFAGTDETTDDQGAA
jgi:hypothetical protein